MSSINKPQHKDIVLIVAYYLSKFGNESLSRFKYTSYREAFNDLGARLNVKPNTLKNRRDDFDSITDNNRKGWHQKELSMRHLNVVQKFGEVSEDGFWEIVKDIIYGSKDEKKFLEALIHDDVDLKVNLRGVTGRKAEEIFVEYYRQNGMFNSFGNLIDTRDEGCGFDFKTEGKNQKVFEVKGLSSITGGITFTDKEWIVAKKLQEKYILVLINNVFEDPEIHLISNPYKNFLPNKTISKVVSITWTVQWNGVNNMN